MKSAVIELRNVNKRYASFALQDVCMRIPKGSIMGFVGENGAGKSTIIKAIMNLITIDGGTISVFEKPHDDDEVLRKQDIGIVFDESNFYDMFQLNDISKVMQSFYANWDDAKFWEFVKRFELTEKKDIKNYSRGMKMKTAIAVALSHDSKLLILDEATSGLDPIARDEILEILQEFMLDEEHSILMSSHIVSDLEKIADYITFIHEGRILLSESKDELMNRYVLLRCGDEVFSKIPQNLVMGSRKGQFGVEALVENKDELWKQYDNVAVDRVSLEEIILLLARG